MSFSRRDVFKFVGLSVVLVALEGCSSKAKKLTSHSNDKKVEVENSIIKLNIPEAPESGAIVPVEVTVDYPMDADNYISNIKVLTTKSKIDDAVSFDLTPANGMAYLYVNIKLGQTQDVVVLATTNNGKVFKASQKVKVAIGGCGG
jgi:sulfur-oxidizing protein SoxY